jgi:Spx/MgsR family transcriptional regulator
MIRGMNTLATPASINPPVSVFGIPNCDTVKKARAWLSAHGVNYEFHDFKKLGVPVDQLPRWIAAVGWEPLLNRKGTTWRKLDDASRAAVLDAPSASALMLARPSVIKRPVVAWPNGQITVGFDESRWQGLIR